MSKSKLDNKKLLLISLIIVMVVLDILIFSIEKSFDFGFWFAYIFFMISYITTLVTILTIFDKLNTVFIKYPLGYCSIIYTLVTIVILLFSMMINMSKKVALIINLIPFTLFVVIYIFGIIGVRTILNNKTEVAEKVNFMKSLSIKIEKICALVKDELLKKELKKISENVSYSDPMSSENVQSIENEMENLVNSFENDLENVTIENIKKFSDLLENRNNIVKDSK